MVLISVLFFARCQAFIDSFRFTIHIYQEMSDQEGEEDELKESVFENGNRLFSISRKSCP